jgi:uracil-DNA glycosylase family 4
VQFDEFSPVSFLEPSSDCSYCSRLADYRKELRECYSDWYNSPVGFFGDRKGRLLIIGLAPGKSGANRTGRPFTGDDAGKLLYRTLISLGFATGEYLERPDDSLALCDCAIVNAVRCAPPKNKPIGSEISACRSFLVKDIDSMQNLKAILCLGRISHDSTVKALEQRISHYPFKHGGCHKIGNIAMFDSYHCSRYNTNTRVLTDSMFFDVLSGVREYLKYQKI